MDIHRPLAKSDQRMHEHCGWNSAPPMGRGRAQWRYTARPPVASNDMSGGFGSGGPCWSLPPDCFGGDYIFVNKRKNHHIHPLDAQRSERHALTITDKGAKHHPPFLDETSVMGGKRTDALVSTVKLPTAKQTRTSLAMKPSSRIHNGRRQQGEAVGPCAMVIFRWVANSALGDGCVGRPAAKIS